MNGKLGSSGRRCVRGGLAFVAFLLLLKFGIFFFSTPPHPQAKKVSIHLVCCEFLLLSSYVFNVSHTLGTLKAALSVFHIHKAVTGLCVMPPSSTCPFLHRSYHRATHPTHAGFLWSALNRRGGKSSIVAKSSHPQTVKPKQATF